MSAPVGAAAPTPGVGSSWQRRLGGPVPNAIAVAVFCVAGIAVFAFIHRYATNILYDDQWTDVDLIRRWHAGTLTIGNLWAQHNENRIPVPDLIVLALGATTHLQVLVEDFLSGLALCATAALTILTHRRRSPGIPLIAYCPVAVLILSFAVVGDALFGFNLSWFLVLFALAVTLYLADRPVLTRLALAGAVVAAVAGSLSSFQGLLIWPAVAVLLWLRGRPARTIAVWVTCAAATAAAYFVHFNFALTGATSSSPSTPGGDLRFGISEIGNVLGGQVTAASSFELGLLILGIASAALVVGARRGGDDGAAVGVTFTVFGLGFIVSAAIGRSAFGLIDALRYAPFAITVWVGAYLVLLSRLTRDPRTTPSAPGATAVDAGPGDPGRSTSVRRVPALLFGLLLVVVGGQVVESTFQGVASAAGWHAEESRIANVSANIDAAPDGVVAATLGSYPVPYLRRMVRAASTERLSLFATSAAAAERRSGLDHHLLIYMLRPSNGRRLHGPVLLDVGMRVPHPEEVTFVATGGGLHGSKIATGVLTLYGYLARWDTTTVPNGSYQVSGMVRAASGTVYTSAPIVITVANR